MNATVLGVKADAIPRHVRQSPAFASLSAPARDLLLVAAAMIAKGAQNGHVALSTVALTGWHPEPWKITQRAETLVQVGLLVRTVEGGKKRAALYAVSWAPFDIAKC